MKKITIGGFERKFKIPSFLFGGFVFFVILHWSDFIKKSVYSGFLESIIIVTGPSFNNVTFISAPNSPV